MGDGVGEIMKNKWPKSLKNSAIAEFKPYQPWVILWVNINGNDSGNYP
jgi:hypothetical protein